jgi:hypothetical protein
MRLRHADCEDEVLRLSSVEAEGVSEIRKSTDKVSTETDEKGDTLSSITNSMEQSPS